MAEEKEKKENKEKKATPPNPALVEAVKRHAAGKATAEDKDLMLGVGGYTLTRARSAAGIKSKGGGGFRSTVDVWIALDGQDASRATKFGWKEFGALKKKVRESGKKVRMALVPAGQKP